MNNSFVGSLSGKRSHEQIYPQADGSAPDSRGACLPRTSQWCGGLSSKPATGLHQGNDLASVIKVSLDRV